MSQTLQLALLWNVYHIWVNLTFHFFQLEGRADDEAFQDEKRFLIKSIRDLREPERPVPQQQWLDHDWRDKTQYTRNSVYILSLQTNTHVETRIRWKKAVLLFLVVDTSKLRSFVFCLKKFRIIYKIM